MYVEYLKEREGAEVLELPEGFAVIKQLPDCLYLQDIYVKPEFRKTGIGRSMLEVVEQSAKNLGYSKVLGSCSPLASGSTGSLKAMLACGFELSSCEKDLIFLVKKVQNG